MKESTSLFKVKYLNFADYQKALVMRENASWQLLLGADLVIGGVEFGDDFLYIF